ncbi:adenylate/guanylate cyclase domain-containing protein [Nocardia sp. NPDC050412]|uniref:adenylate/guanylate cyclase domain-containing protein n=1 Tax=Nocardia sp. NPDC050412 TaxID=3364320 RepID=UPI0037B97ED6
MSETAQVWFVLIFEAIQENVMGLLDDVNTQIDKTINQKMTISKRQESNNSVPKPEDLGYAEGKLVSATYLYSDMLNSSGLAASADKEEAARVFRGFLNVATKIIRESDGHIRSFDGDRVMGIFTGAWKEDRAVKSAMRIKYAVNDILTPAVHKQFPKLKASGWTLKQVSGIASGEALLARAGFRDNDDMISIGVSPNLAAKLSDLRDSVDAGYVTIIGKGTHAKLSESHRLSKGTDMWNGPYTMQMGGKSYSYYRTSYHWSFT